MFKRIAKATIKFPIEAAVFMSMFPVVVLATAVLVIAWAFDDGIEPVMTNDDYFEKW